jgi:hypothetical protein
LQQALGHGEAVHQLVDLLQVVRARQRNGQLLQRLFQVAVIVERFDQEAQSSAVHFGQAQRQGLAVQEGGEGLLRTRQFGRVGLIAFGVVAGAGRGVATPLAVVGRHLHRAVAAPVGLLGALLLWSASDEASKSPSAPVDEALLAPE